VVIFGRRKPESFTELKETMRPTPDADGVTRVFPSELWDDPKIGKFLQEAGFAPDDARNILPKAEDYIALFAAAKKRLDERTEAFNRDMTKRHGYCHAVPFLVIDHTIWDGEHGAFLYAQMKLAGHPGVVPAVTDVMTKRVIDWKLRHDLALEAYGVTATGGQGITRQQYEAEHDTLRREIVDNVGWMKPRIISELLRVQA
jgi:hypothetical protein